MRRILNKGLLAIGIILAALGFIIVAAIIIDVFSADITIEPASDCEERLVIGVSEEAFWVDDNRYEVKDIEQVLNDLAMQPDKPCLLLITTDNYDVKLMAKVKHYADINKFDAMVMTIPAKKK